MMPSAFFIVRYQKHNSKMRKTYWRSSPRAWVEDTKDATAMTYRNATREMNGMMQYTGHISLEPVEEVV